MQNQPLRDPNTASVEFIAKPIRVSEDALAAAGRPAVVDPSTQPELEVRIIFHNDISTNNCRDLRTLQLCLAPAVW